MNPLLARLYPHLAMKTQPISSQQILKSVPKPTYNQVQNKEPIKETIKQELKEEHIKDDIKKRTIDDELDAYINELEEKYNREPTPPPYSKRYSKPPTPKKQSAEEQKERILKQLSKKKITKATEQIENMKKLHEETKGDEKELKKKEAELRKGIKLIRQTRILAQTGDLNIDKPSEEVAKEE
jgi:hypothetical protein